MKQLCAVLLLCQSAWASSETLLAQYDKIHNALSTDNIVGAAEEAKVFDELVTVWLEENAEDPDKGHMVAAKVGAVQLSLVNSPALAALTFGHFSRGMVDFVRAKTELQTSLQLFYCPMHQESGADYGFWFQPLGEKIANPYFGSKMPTCGSKKKWGSSTFGTER